MRHLRERMDTGIGAACAVQLEVLPRRHRPRGTIDFTLNRLGVLLNLPAAVPRAGVLDRQLEARHWAILRAGGAGTAGRAGGAYPALLLPAQRTHRVDRRRAP